MNMEKWIISFPEKIVDIIKLIFSCVFYVKLFYKYPKASQQAHQDNPGNDNPPTNHVYDTN